MCILCLLRILAFFTLIYTRTGPEHFTSDALLASLKKTGGDLHGATNNKTETTEWLEMYVIMSAKASTYYSCINFQHRTTMDDNTHSTYAWFSCTLLFGGR